MAKSSPLRCAQCGKPFREGDTLVAALDYDDQFDGYVHNRCLLTHVLRADECDDFLALVSAESKLKLLNQLNVFWSFTWHLIREECWRFIGALPDGLSADTVANRTYKHIHKSIPFDPSRIDKFDLTDNNIARLVACAAKDWMHDMQPVHPGPGTIKWKDLREQLLDRVRNFDDWEYIYDETRVDPPEETATNGDNDSSSTE